MPIFLSHPTFLIILSFVFGAMIGSFLNVCIYRVPAGKSIINPPSACPNCGQPIKPYDNIPIISFILLGAKCRNCKTPVSWRYPAVEFLTGALFAGIAYTFGASIDMLIYVFLVSILITVSFIDLDHQIIPDKITLPGMVIGILLSALSLLPVGWQQSLLGFFIGGGLLYLSAVLSRGGMGGGDIKLAAFMGIFLGWRKILLTLFVGVLLGSIVGVVMILFRHGKRKDKIPFGPFLVLGALTSIFWGEKIITWYMSFLICGNK